MGKEAVTSWLCCPCRCLLSVVATVLIVSGLVALALYLLFRPHLIHATVTAATLSNFSLTPRTWLLCYNLSLALSLSLRNPNTRISIYYHALAADAYYQAQHFSHADIPDFFQDVNETTHIAPTFVGQHPLLGGVAATGFRKEASDHATFAIDVKLTATMKLKVWVLRVPGPKPKIECELRIKRWKTSPGAARPEFQPTECRVWF